MWAGRVPPRPRVGICWDWTVKVVLQCRGEGKAYIREQWRTGDKIEPNEPLLFLWMCRKSVCSLSIWYHFDSGKMLFNPFKRYVLGCICKCSSTEVRLRPLSSWYCFQDVFWGPGCWAGFPTDVDQNDHFCCASHCHFQLCRISSFFSPKFEFVAKWGKDCLIAQMSFALIVCCRGCVLLKQQQGVIF